LKSRQALTYCALVGLPVAILVAVLGRGSGAPAQDIARHTAERGLPSLSLLAAQVSVIILVSRVVGSLAAAVRQPRVIGEVLAGILLGPSLLGWLAPGLSASLFPPASFGALYALSQLGLVVFMFLVGLQLDVQELRHQGPAALLISHASIATPMALGALLAIYLYPRLSPSSVSFVAFALFMGAAMSITAFPVLARILSERGLTRSRMGTMAIACAAIDDVTGWCVLAYIVGRIRTADSALSLPVIVAGLVLFIVVMVWGIRIPLARIERTYFKRGELSDNLKAFLLMLLMLSALATETLGLHLLFGAFLAGAVMPRHPDFVAYVVGKFESLTVLLLLPLFFAYTGLRTNIGQLKGYSMWWYCVLIILVAVAGKVGGTSVAARFGGMPWRESLALGALMNTRGLMELVVLNIGLEIQVISPTLFSMMVVMAIATTMMTPPLLHWVYPKAVVQ
jgi:Kef-type K+ transport system membrane component KefB